MVDSVEILLSNILDELKVQNGRAGFVPRQSETSTVIPVATLDVSSALTDNRLSIPPSSRIIFTSIPASLSVFSIRIGDPRNPLVDMLTLGQTLRFANPVQELFITTIGGVAGDVIQYIAGDALEVAGEPSIPGARAGSTYGRLIAIESATKTRVATAATEDHTYQIPDTLGVPVGEIHVYKALNLRVLAAALRVVQLYKENSITGYFCQLMNNTTTRNNDLNACNAFPEPYLNSAAGEQNPGGDVVLYPGDLLSFAAAGILITETTRLSFTRERYKTALIPADVSAQVDLVVV